ncbi:hypothetical protein [Dactylosporangium darangshiense]|uniref:hypothetical protein n=1 Tax=Dactylosporangium darangshiense TaxID=579108 RepID=UPI00362B9D8B
MDLRCDDDGRVDVEAGLAGLNARDRLEFDEGVVAEGVGAVPRVRLPPEALRRQPCIGGGGDVFER